jgi:hypothetical protein
LKFKPKKCALFQTRVFLSQRVSQSRTEMRMSTVRDWPVPTNTKEVERFANYHRRFVVDYARITTPLYQVTRKNHSC